MGRTASIMGVLGVVALVGIAAYASTRSGAPTSSATRNTVPPVERVRVEVLNAGGVAGRARAATLVLRELGFDVVSFGNARSFDRDSSTVVDRVGRPDLARAVADALGIDEVGSDPDPNLFVDVSVLLGSEWRGEDGTEPDEAAPEREAWDPRGWLGR